jgi:DNA modification methylase
MTPYYEDDLAVIYHGDVLEVLPSITDVDLIFTSPPYNLGTTNGGRSGMHAGSLAAKDLAGGYATYDDALPQAEYDAWQTDVVAACWEALSPTGALFYNHKPRIQGGVAKLPTDYGAGLPLRQVIIWDRGTGLNFSEAFFLPKCEWVVVWARPEWRLRDRSASQVGDVWKVAPEPSAGRMRSNRTNGAHPAPFPVGLPARAIEATAPALVLDPFMGSGTTLRAARDAGVRSIGIELSEAYCELAATRLAQGSLFAEVAR